MLNHLLNLLNTIMLSPTDEKMKYINEFIDIVALSEELEIEITNDALLNTLDDTTMHLLSYEPNEIYRREDPSFYGDSDLGKFIKESIVKINRIID